MNETTRAALRPRALTAVSEIREAVEAVRNVHRWWLGRTSFTLRIPADDALYPDAHAWILTLLPPEKRRDLMVRSTISRGSEVSDSDSQPEVERLILTSTDSTEQHVIVDGYQIGVYVNRPEVSDKSHYLDPDVLVLTARNREGQQAVVRRLTALLEDRLLSARRPVMRLLNTSWGSWNRRGDLPPRPVESVVLAEGQMERIMGDLEAFLADETTYNARAIPWHRGYLLHGPPGTGKTSIAKAMASAYGLDLWYAPLGDVKDDSNLLNLLSQVHPRSMLLLEDVDVFAATQERKADTSAHLSLSGLLNALDGVATPHGLITVMTTNAPGVLDSALLRPGRIDMVEEILPPDDEQVDRMFRVFYGERPYAKVKAGGRNAAEITEVFKRNMRDPNGAVRSLCNG